MYVFDTSPLSNLFRNFYRSIFPSLWERFDALIANGEVTSTREVQHELEQFSRADEDWLGRHRAIFTTPTLAETGFVREIFRTPHFRNNIEVRKLLKGGYNADAFVIAKARANDGTVVTLESRRSHAANIPAICEYFDIPCTDLEGFMVRERWQF